MILVLAFLSPILGLITVGIRNKITKERYGWDSMGWVTAVFFSTIFLLMIWFIIQMCAIEVVNDAMITQQTVDAFRAQKNMTANYEVTALNIKVIELNQRIVCEKYWYDHPLTNWLYRGSSIKDIAFIQ